MTTPKPIDESTKAGRLRRWALDALLRHEADGTLSTNVRFLYYEAAMEGVVVKGDPNRGMGPGGRGRRPDQDLIDATKWLREQGHVPWSWIEDRTRHIEDRRGDGDSITDGVGKLLDHIRIDPWDKVLPIIVTEAETVVGGLTRVAHDYRVPIIPTRGQSNGWLRTTVRQALMGRQVAVCYVGDADKAGDDIERNTHRVLSRTLPLHITEWERVALTWEQVEAEGLPTIERTDRRNKLTYEVCELEALGQRKLLDAVSDWLADRLPDGVTLEAVREREWEQRTEVAGRLGIG